jgi:hypothetical protein
MWAHRQGTIWDNGPWGSEYEWESMIFCSLLSHANAGSHNSSYPCVSRPAECLAGHLHSTNRFAVRSASPEVATTPLMPRLFALRSLLTNLLRMFWRAGSDSGETVVTRRPRVPPSCFKRYAVGEVVVIHGDTALVFGNWPCMASPRHLVGNQKAISVLTWEWRALRNMYTGMGGSDAAQQAQYHPWGVSSAL